MDDSRKYRLEPVGTANTSRRGVAFLLGHPEIITVEEFKQRGVAFPLLRRQLLSRMDTWISRVDLPPITDKYHGWDASQHRGKHTMCFVFKFRNSKASVRLYGFLCNPDGANPRFQLFVPIVLTDKRGDDTDLTLLDRIAALSREPGIVACVRTYRAAT